jgi:hypothetical protein
MRSCYKGARMLIVLAHFRFMSGDCLIPYNPPSICVTLISVIITHVLRKIMFPVKTPKNTLVIFS